MTSTLRLLAVLLAITLFVFSGCEQDTNGHSSDSQGNSTATVSPLARELIAYAIAVNDFNSNVAQLETDFAYLVEFYSPSFVSTVWKRDMSELLDRDQQLLGSWLKINAPQSFLGFHDTIAGGLAVAERLRDHYEEWLSSDENDTDAISSLWDSGIAIGNERVEIFESARTALEHGTAVYADQTAGEEELKVEFDAVFRFGDYFSEQVRQSPASERVAARPKSGSTPTTTLPITTPSNVIETDKIPVPVETPLTLRIVVPISLPTAIVPTQSPVPTPTQLPLPTHTPIVVPPPVVLLPTQVPTPFPVVSLPTATTGPTIAPQPSPPTATAPAASSAPSNILNLVESLVVNDNPKSALPSYNRSSWKHWNDEDSDCINARHEVLIEESTTSVVMDGNCRVGAGQWFGVFTGEQFSNPSNLDVDHMVPLKNAHDSGGWAWSASKKEEFANYLGFAGHLLVVSASANRSKGASGPESWKPTRTDYWCQYGSDWAEIKATWALTVTSPEKTALIDMVNKCGGSNGGGVAPPTPISGQPTSVPSTATITSVPTTPVPTQTVDPSLPFDPFGPDRNCGDFLNWEDAYGFYLAAGGPSQDPHGLDGNGDGDPCESLHGSDQPAPTVTSISVPATSTSVPSIPTSVPATAVPTPTATSSLPYDPLGEDRNCGDFSSWDVAYAFYLAAGGPAQDPHGLDGNNDGDPCKSLH